MVYDGCISYDEKGGWGLRRSGAIKSDTTRSATELTGGMENSINFKSEIRCGFPSLCSSVRVWVCLAIQATKRLFTGVGEQGVATRLTYGTSPRVAPTPPSFVPQGWFLQSQECGWRDRANPNTYGTRQVHTTRWWEAVATRLYKNYNSSDARQQSQVKDSRRVKSVFCVSKSIDKLHFRRERKKEAR